MSLVLASVAFLCSCGGSDGDIHSQSVAEIEATLWGTWYCVYQEWYEDGDTWYSEYDVPSDYYMVFRDDYTGYVVSGRDELFEIGTGKTKDPYTWALTSSSSLRLILTDRGNDKVSLSILELGNEEMTLKFYDSGYRIICEFVRDE